MHGAGRHGYSRRSMLKIGGGLAIGTMLAACGGNSKSVSSVFKKYPIADSGIKLPTGDVKFTYLDTGDAKARFWEAFRTAYENKHPNITFDFQVLPGPKLSETLSLGLRNKAAPDMFLLGPTIQPPQAVKEGWVAPLDDLIPDFDTWKNNLPEGSLVEGAQVFDGKTYTVSPMVQNERYQNLMLHNTKLIEEAGYDPTTGPLTWSEFRDAAKKITKNGNGQYYGMVLPGGTPPVLQQFIDMLARRTTGVYVENRGQQVAARTGEPPYLTDAYLEALELVVALKADGSLFPESTSITTQASWARMAQGAVGMLMSGPWVVDQWHRENPDFNYVVTGFLVPDEGKPYPLSYDPVPGTAAAPFINAESKLKEVAADVIAYVTSRDGQLAWGELAGVGNPPMLPAAQAKGPGYEEGRRALELAKEGMVMGPSIRLRKPHDASIFYQQTKAISPSLGDVVQGVLSGQIKDTKTAMKDLADRTEKGLEDALRAARAKGAEISRDDFVFPNFDPMSDYTKKEYKDL